MSSNNENIHPNVAIDLSNDSSDDDVFMPKPVMFHNSSILVSWPRRLGKTAVENHTSVGEGPRAR
eukprot:2567111-Ditylum_brightwellii.AAC.1